MRKFKITKVGVLAAIIAWTGAMLSSCSDDFSYAPVHEPEGGLGTGVWDDPMTANQVLIGSVNNGLSSVWAKGYIVGVVNTDISNTLNQRTAQFDGDFTVQTNLLFSMYTPEELTERFVTKDADGTLLTDTRWEHVATVQLKSGTEARTDLNLVNHPDNIGRMVCMQGTVGEKYCGAYGLKEVSTYAWGELGREPVVLPPIDGPFWENWDATSDFASYEAQGWANVMVKGGLDGWYIKNFGGTNFVTISAFNGAATGGPYENWLITPGIDLDKLEHKTIQFKVQAAYACPDPCSLELFVMTSQDPLTSVNTRLDYTAPTPPEGAYGSWIDSGLIDLSAFSGKIYIGWRYFATHGSQGYSATYSIDDINVGQASEPTLPPTPSDGSLYNMLKSGDETCDWTFENIQLPAGLNYIWKWDAYNGSHYLNATAGTSAVASLSYAVSPEISLEGVKDVKVEFDHAAKFQTTIRTLCKLAVREAGSTQWTEFEIPDWPKAGGWTFASSGKIDISAFDGKRVQIALKYESSTAGTDKWEVNNLKVTGIK